jgi:hypothetical protein
MSSRSYGLKKCDRQSPFLPALGLGVHRIRFAEILNECLLLNHGNDNIY